MANKKSIRTAPTSSSNSAVSVPGNRKIAQVYVASSVNNTALICVNVTYKGSDTPFPRITVCDVVDGLPATENVLSAYSATKNDLTLSDDVIISPSITQTSEKSYAIVVEYPTGRSNDTFEWKAAATKDSKQPCFTFDGTAWKPVDYLCEFVVYSGDAAGPDMLQPASKGPVGM